MSIRIKIMNEIDRRPQSLRRLKDIIGNDKKVTKEVAALMAQGRIVKKDGLLYSVAQVGKQPGRLQSVHSRSGRISLVKEGLPCTVVKLGATFGFAQRKDGEGDIFLPGRSMMGAMPGDEVLVKLFDRPRVPGTQEGEVVAVTRPQNEFVGTVRRDYYDQLVVLPDACPSLEIPLKKSALAGAREGDKIVATLLRRGAGHADHRAGVGFVFGSAEEAKQCARALLYAHGIASKFPPEALKEADALKDAQVKLKDTKDRMDLRSLPIFTIDSASTKDIDDAISICESEYGFELGVHIADVSHYVPAGSALDKEAFARGTSVYYADSVIPMLPRELSNGICSLNPGENRLAFSCLIWLDKQGNIKSYRFEKTVIRSRVKGVYSEINALYEGSGEEALQEKYAEVAEQLPALRRLYEERLRQRRERGGMDIESGESKL
ncbi:MAG: RNB domain-containing ribonuclease, partial [Oscillospiraceae bacterium]|nr:RNB domain-containing ribonuclease [Oscillospiraceae bacterium]